MEDSVKRNREHFGAHADYYVNSQVHAKGASLARLVELTQPRKDWVVLDVSTGAGHTALTFAPLVARVVAVDLTPEMLDAGKRLAAERGIGNIEFRPADAQALPLDDNTFDLVTNRIALHHYPDARLGVLEMARVCKPGGLVALDDNVVPPEKQIAGYINHFEKLRDSSHNWAYPVARLQALLEEAKLKVEHTETLKKEMAFESWASQMQITDEIRDKLRKLLLGAPEGVRAVMTPRTEGDKLFFTLTEAIIIGRKP